MKLFKRNFERKRVNIKNLVNQNGSVYECRQLLEKKIHLEYEKNPIINIRSLTAIHNLIKRK